jgi:histone-lysine N-methyltransferase SETMAR
VPHELTNDLRKKRVAIGSQLLAILEEAQSTGFRQFVTGDESWIYLSYASRAVWTISQDKVPTREKQKISTKKFMPTVFGSVDGFHVVEFLPTDTKFNTAYFVEHIIPLHTTRLEMGASKRRGILYRLHCDNARPHNSSRSRALTNDYGFQRIPHPPYSPDLESSDFYLFGTLKRQL